MVKETDQEKLDRLAKLDQANRDRVSKFMEKQKKAGNRHISGIISSEAYDRLSKLKDAATQAKEPATTGHIITALLLTDQSLAPTVKKTIEIEIKPTEEIDFDELDFSNPEKVMDEMGMESKSNTGADFDELDLTPDPPDTDVHDFDEKEIITEEDLPGLPDFEDPEELDLEDPDPEEIKQIMKNPGVVLGLASIEDQKISGKDLLLIAEALPHMTHKELSDMLNGYKATTKQGKPFTQKRVTQNMSKAKIASQK